MVLRYPAAVKAARGSGSRCSCRISTRRSSGSQGVRRLGRRKRGAAGRRRPVGGARVRAAPGSEGLGLPSQPRGGAAADGRRPEPIIAEFARPVSFLDVMREAAPGRDLSAWDRAVVSYRVGDEKLHWSSDGHHRLYDLAADPTEEHDLAPERPERVRDLAAEVEAWLARPGARPPLGPRPRPPLTDSCRGRSPGAAQSTAARGADPPSPPQCLSNFLGLRARSPLLRSPAPLYPAGVPAHFRKALRGPGRAALRIRPETATKRSPIGSVCWNSRVRLAGQRISGPCRTAPLPGLYAGRAALVV